MVLALAEGALLGALVAMPYEQALGMPGEAFAILRSAVATAVLSGLCAFRPGDLVFDAQALAHTPQAPDTRGAQQYTAR
jgi:hypothetical protein